MQPLNPFNCSAPGNLFVGYERLRTKILGGFANGSSFAIIGGRRCGKTSLLLQLQRDLQENGLAPFCTIVRILDIQGMDQITPIALFQRIYELLIDETDAPAWESDRAGQAYRTFLDHLRAAKPTLDKKYGSKWLFIVLIDELDYALKRLHSDQFFQNLRNLLMLSEFNSYFRVAATGVKEMTKLIYSGSSPLNNLRCVFLRTLTGIQARELVAYGFPEALEPDTEHWLFSATGKHPFILQALLEKMWNLTKNEFARAERESLIRSFLLEHPGFQRWLEQFGPAEHAVYQCLSQAQDGHMHVRDIRNSVPQSLKSKVDEALTILSYHGVIEDRDPDEAHIAGTIFRDWYAKNLPEEKLAADKPKSIASAETDRRPPQLVSGIQISPTFNISQDNSRRADEAEISVESFLKIMEMLKQELHGMSLDEGNRRRAEHALEAAEIEMAVAKTPMQADKKAIEKAIERTASVLKSAGATAESAKNFIEKAKYLAPYLGQAAQWIDKLW